LGLADATDNLNMLSTTATGVALSQYIETGDCKFSQIIHYAQDVVTRSTENFSSVGEQIATVLHETPDE
jgi:hypothetical protein